jgi:hypothetical protein
MQHYQQGQPHGGYGQPLPARTDVPERSTFMAPGQNNVWPRLTPPRGLPGNLTDYITTTFRQLLQDRAERPGSPLHIFTYNLVSNNWFANPLFTQWVQLAVDFADYLVVCQGNSNPPQVAADKAVGMCYAGLVASMAAQYPAVAQMVSGNQQLMQGLVKASQDLEAIHIDVEAFLRNGRNPPQFQQQPQNTVVNQSFHGYNVHGQAQVAQPSMGGQSAPGGGGSFQGSSGRYHETPAEEPPHQESWSTQHSTHTQPVQQGQESAHMATQPTYDENTPRSIEDIEFDPDHFQPFGVEINEERPWDVIYAPGGVECRPAHLSGWKSVRNDEHPWSESYDPMQYCLYHVKWPDGWVEEHPVAWSLGMDYLKHEIDEKLRRVKLKSTDKLVANNIKVLNYDADETVGLGEVIDLSKDGKLSDETPVLIEEILLGSTDEENEERARELIREALTLSADAPLPAHEYQSVKAYPFCTNKECVERIEMLATADSLPAVARGLKEALSDGILSLRHYRVLNQRLTRELNRILKDNLSMSVQVDDFCEDIKELYTYLQGKGKADVVTVIKSRSHQILKRPFMMEVEWNEDNTVIEACDLVDVFLNVQVNWRSEQLESVVMDEEPVLISQTYHPKLHKLVRGLLDRHQDAGTLEGRNVRLISLDGVYYEIFKGWLVDNALLIKRA